MLPTFYEPGKVYYSILLPDSIVLEHFPDADLNYDPLVFINEPTKFITTIDTIFFNDNETEKRVLVKTSTKKIKPIINVELRCVGTKSPYLAIAIVEVPGLFKTIPKPENRSFEIVEVQRILENTSFKRSLDFPAQIQTPIDSAFSVVQSNDATIIVCKPGHWLDFKELICPDICGGYSIKQVQEKLKQKGYYDGSIDNVLSDEVKAALRKFQKDIDNETGQLDFKTLKMLGVPY